MEYITYLPSCVILGYINYILGLKLRYWVHLIVDIFVNVFADVFGGTFSALGCSSYPLEDREGSRCVVDSKVLVQVEHNLKTYFCKWFCNQKNTNNKYLYNCLMLGSCFPFCVKRK